MFGKRQTPPNGNPTPPWPPEEKIDAALVDRMMNIIDRTPAWIVQQIDLEPFLMNWTSGYASTNTRSLVADTPRMNNLAMTEFIANQLTEYLASLQMNARMV